MMVSQWNSSGIHHIAALHQSPRVTAKNERVTPEKLTGRIIFMSMFNDISWGSEDNKKECESSAQLVSFYAKRFGAGQMVIPRTWIREEVELYE